MNGTHVFLYGAHGHRTFYLQVVDELEPMFVQKYRASFQTDILLLLKYGECPECVAANQAPLVLLLQLWHELQ